jgi:hypothetical protein
METIATNLAKLVLFCIGLMVSNVYPCLAGCHLPNEHFPGSCEREKVQFKALRQYIRGGKIS